MDFYNSAYRLVIEVDGPVHVGQVELDRARQDVLEQLGLNVFRVGSDDVEKSLSSVLEMIRSKINELKINTSESPSPPERLDEE